MPLSTPGGTFTCKLHGRRHSPRTATTRAGIGDPHPFAAAGRASGRDLEEAAGLDDLAPAAAVVAGRGHGPLAGTGTLALAAKLLAIHVDGTVVPRAASISSISSFSRRSGPVRGPRRRLPKRSPNNPPPKISLKADMISSADRKSWNACTVQAGVAITVVSLPLVRIGKHFISFGRFLESLRGLFITRISVRMILERHLSIGFLDLVDGRIAADAEDFVKIALRGCHWHGVSVN